MRANRNVAIVNKRMVCKLPIREVRANRNHMGAGNVYAQKLPIREVRNGPKKLDSFSGGFQCTVALGYAALASGCRL